MAASAAAAASSGSTEAPLSSDCAIAKEAQPAAAVAIAKASCHGTAKDGDYVILWGTYTQIFGIVIQAGAITNNKFGSFHHDDLIGQTYGSKVHPRKGNAWMALLRPSAELITQSLVHRTQIIYHADISLLLAVLDTRPGQVMVEAGTGSGSVSASFARALRPGGKLHTFEFHEDRQAQAAEDFRKYGLDDVITSRHGDVCGDGFGDALGPDSVDGVFLDLPAPWQAIQHVDKVLVEGGKICTFSPCIEQIDKTAAELRRRRYHDIRMVETLAVNWGVKADAPRKKRRLAGGAPPAEEAATPAAQDAPSWVSYQMPMRGHTGFLLFATRPPHDEP